MNEVQATFNEFAKRVSPTQSMTDLLLQEVIALRKSVKTMTDMNARTTAALNTSSDALNGAAFLIAAIQEFPDFDDGPTDQAKPLLFLAGKTLLGINAALNHIDELFNKDT